ncbi:MAG: aminopeptidase P family protein [Lachnospiraceae bacterium]|nr:aminopeptidase P family protein [Lachnospiraceae bacterium]
MQGIEEKIKDFLQERELDGLLVADGHNMRYLSGFTGATGYLYISRQQQVILTDSRYTLQAREEAPRFQVVEVSRQEGYKEKLLNLTQEDETKRLGFEDQVMMYATVESLKEKLTPVGEWVPLRGALSTFRQIKTEGEIERMAQAEAIGDKAFDYLLGELRPGVTELTIAAKLEFYMKTHGAEDIAFPSIVASGLHSAMPHATPSRKKLEQGDFITLDFGCRYEGYCSDMTRTVVLGKASERQREIYQIVLEAQLAGLEAVRAGISGKEADEAARAVIEKAGYGEYFGHALGHSVGLEVHERPSLSQGDDTILKPGMIETVEPGIYVPGFGGVRIEDMVVVTETGCRNLTHSPKELIEL